MRKKILIVIAILFCSYCYCQDSILFTLHFKPLLNYTQDISQNSHMTMTYIGNDTMLGRLKEKGMRNPTIIDNSLIMKSLVSKGELNSEKKMPVKIEIL